MLRGRTIAQEIEHFHRKNDLGAMLGFLRGQSHNSVQQESPWAGGIAPLRDNYFEQKMRIEPPVAAEQLLPTFPALPLLKSCKSALQELANAAYEAQGRPEVREYVA